MIKTSPKHAPFSRSRAAAVDPARRAPSPSPSSCRLTHGRTPPGAGSSHAHGHTNSSLRRRQIPPNPAASLFGVPPLALLNLPQRLRGRKQKMGAQSSAPKCLRPPGQPSLSATRPAQADSMPTGVQARTPAVRPSSDRRCTFFKLSNLLERGDLPWKHCRMH